jgi:hypothetical protein
MTLKLPKASLLGGCVSLTWEELYGAGEPRVQASTLKIHGLRVPTLIGVNDNERKANQVVVANVEVDKLTDRHDAYCQLEETIVEVRLPRVKLKLPSINHHLLLFFIMHPICLTEHILFPRS